MTYLDCLLTSLPIIAIMINKKQSFYYLLFINISLIILVYLYYRDFNQATLIYAILATLISNISYILKNVSKV